MKGLKELKLTGDSKKVFQILINESPMPVALYTGREMIIEIANDAMLKTWDKDNSVIGRPIRDALPELEGQPFFGLLQEIYLSGKEKSFTDGRADLLRHGKLETFYFNYTYKPLKREDGEVWGILNTAADVTELVLTRERLVYNEENTHFALNSAEIGTWIFDPLHQLVHWDDRCKQLFKSREEDSLSYDDVIRCIVPEDREMVNQAVLDAINPSLRKRYDVEFRIEYPNQSRVGWVRCRGKAYFKDDVAVRFAGTAVDISEDKRKEAALAEIESRLQTIFENTSVGIATTDLLGNFILVNRAYCDLSGYVAPELYGMNRTSLIHPDDISANESLREMLIRGEKPYNVIESRLLCKDGTLRWLKNTISLNLDSQGKPETLVIISQDITSEVNIRQEQQKMLFLVNNSSDFISISNWEGTLTYLNEAGQRMMGFDNMEQARRHQTEYLQAYEVQKLRDVINPSLQATGKWQGEVIFKNFKTGEAVPGHVTSLLLSDPSTGEPLGRASVVRDLRPEIAAKKALEESEHLFRNITTASPAGLWMTAPEGPVVYVNQSWVDWTGMPLEAHMGKGILEMVHVEDLEPVKSCFRAAFGARRPVDFEFRLRHKDGSFRWVKCSGNPQHLPDGSFSGYIGSCTDITDQKALQQQKDDFLAIASHELKTPVTSIKAYTQILESMFRKSGDLQKSGMLSRMDAQLNRLTGLISNLLDVTKIDSGRLDLNEEPVDFVDLACEVADNMQFTTQTHFISKEFTDIGTVYIDKERIGQVMINLISNAIKYSPDAQEILVKAERLGQEVIYRVEDKGIGIPFDKQEKIFEQFYRVKGEKQYMFPGLGLGLYISSEIIKRHGGRIWVSSTEGEGACFCFALPLKQ